MRERMIELANYVMNSLPWGEITPDTAKRIVDRMIEDGATIPVRCKDCKHLEITGCYGECKRGYMGIVKPWDFCSYGERKDNA